MGLCVCCTIQRELWRMSEVWGMRRARQVQRASGSLGCAEKSSTCTGGSNGGMRCCGFWLAPHSTAQAAACSLGRSTEFGAERKGTECMRGYGTRHGCGLRGCASLAAHPRRERNGASGGWASAPAGLLLAARAEALFRSTKFLTGGSQPRGYPEAGCAPHRCQMAASTSLSALSVLTPASQQRSGPTAATAPFALVNASLAPARGPCRCQFCNCR